MDSMHPSKKFYRYATASKNHPGRLFRFQKPIPAPAGCAHKTLVIWCHIMTTHNTVSLDLYYREACLVSAARPVSEVWSHPDVSPRDQVDDWWKNVVERMTHAIVCRYGVNVA